ncbi:MAG: uracil-DNA glycosylase [Desulfobacterales bacterium]|nr:uracil-DNA glycosylase [Desulfobacterales bacterium]MDD4071822.1 uracil-DNA glycosylase [Desulfobacterales bacterium]MDD4392529.1 uracil-DNA glycosylase [Desulfobacterales bacterium]
MSNSLKNVVAVIDEVKDFLGYVSDTGIRGFDCSPDSLEIIDRWRKPESVGIETLEDIRHALGDCRRCRLCGNRRHIVFGEGNPHARLAFVGEAPDQDEDAQGAPFSGAAGQLLTKIIQAIKLSRDQVYICNIIKCRPPEDRDPEPEEIGACLPFFQRQIDAIQPEFICALGPLAAQTLLAATEPVSNLRGRFYDYRGIQVLPTYHPLYLLRNPDKKRDVWEDMKMLMEKMGIERD